MSTRSSKQATPRPRAVPVGFRQAGEAAGGGLSAASAVGLTHAQRVPTELPAQGAGLPPARRPVRCARAWLDRPGFRCFYLATFGGRFTRA